MAAGRDIHNRSGRTNFTENVENMQQHHAGMSIQNLFLSSSKLTNGVANTKKIAFVMHIAATPHQNKFMESKLNQQKHLICYLQHLLAVWPMN